MTILTVHASRLPEDTQAHLAALAQSREERTQAVIASLDKKRGPSLRVDVLDQLYDVYYVLDPTTLEPASLIFRVGPNELLLVTYVMEISTAFLTRRHIEEWLVMEASIEQDA